MQQEDDLRALAKIMEFGRAVSIFILVVHVYVYCLSQYECLASESGCHRPDTDEL